MKPHKGDVVILAPDFSTPSVLLPLMGSPVHAGYPSPAQDWVEDRLDIMKQLIKNPATSFYVEVVGECMIGRNIQAGDVMVVDRSIEVKTGDLAVCWLNGEFLLRHVHREPDGGIRLEAANPDFAPVIVTENCDFIAWGPAMHSVRFDLNKGR